MRTSMPQMPAKLSSLRARDWVQLEEMVSLPNPAGGGLTLLLLLPPLLRHHHYRQTENEVSGPTKPTGPGSRLLTKLKDSRRG